MTDEQSRINAELKKREPSFWSKTSWIQLAYGIWVNQTGVGVGLAFTFSSVAVPQLRTSHINLTLSQEAWFAGVLPLTGPVGSLTSAFILDRLGRRFAMMTCVAPMALGWFCTGLSDSAVQLIVGRAITGFGSGMAVAVPRIYCTEIALPKIRGVLGAFPGITLAIGITMQALLGNFFNWDTICYVCGSYMLFLTFIFFFLPETPYYLIMKGAIEQAEKSLLKFRGKHYRNSIEVRELKDFRKRNHIHRLSLKEVFVALLEPPGLKPIAISAMYSIIVQLSGTGILLFWGVELFQNSKSSLDPNLSYIYMGSLRIVGVVITAFAVYKLRRRFLALFSAFGAGVCAITIGLYIIFTPYPTIFPTIGYIVFMLCSVSGHITLPLLMLYEMVPLRIRGFAGSICVSWLNIVISVVNTAFPFVQNAIGLAATVIGFGVCSFLGGIFLYFFLPETKGLTLQEIEDLFRGKGPTPPVKEIHARGKGLNHVRVDEASLNEPVDKDKNVGNSMDEDVNAKEKAAETSKE